jgi:aspartate racemase
MARIGIITGSGPEAGIDLWSKILQHNRRLLGEAFRGDIDAPEVVIISDPLLGLSMELERNHHTVWPTLARVAMRMDSLVDCYAIACNTLNFYAPQLSALGLKSQFISFIDVVAGELQSTHCTSVALLGAKPVTELSDWSAYRQLASLVQVEALPTPLIEELHALIYEVKALGGSGPSISQRFAALLSQLKSNHVVLACTELPLIALTQTHGKSIIDPTDLVGLHLARRAHSSSSPKPELS